MSNALTDVIPAKYRKGVYAFAFGASAALAAYSAADGDWRVAIITFLTTITSALSYSNVP